MGADDDGTDRLATYGSLRPGERHDHLTTDLEVIGSGTVRGVLDDWEGYPILSLDPTAEPVAVVVFGGIGAERWDELDAFEGPAYRRALVEVRLDDGRMVAARCYLREEGLHPG